MTRTEHPTGPGAVGCGKRAPLCRNSKYSNKLRQYQGVVCWLRCAPPLRGVALFDRRAGLGARRSAGSESSGVAAGSIT